MSKPTDRSVKKYVFQWPTRAVKMILNPLIRGRCNVRVGSFFPVYRGCQLCPNLSAYRKESVRIRTPWPEGPKLKAGRTCVGRGRYGEEKPFPDLQSSIRLAWIHGASDAKLTSCPTTQGRERRTVTQILGGSRKPCRIARLAPRQDEKTSAGKRKSPTLGCGTRSNCTRRDASKRRSKPIARF